MPALTDGLLQIAQGSIHFNSALGWGRLYRPVLQQSTQLDSIGKVLLCKLPTNQQNPLLVCVLRWEDLSMLGYHLTARVFCMLKHCSLVA